MKGEVVHVTIFDVGAEVDLSRVATLLGERPQPAPLVARSPSPAYAVFPAPIEVIVKPDVVGRAPEGARIEIRLHAVGALAVRVRIPFEVERLSDLPRIADAPHFGDLTPADVATRLSERVRADLREARVEPYEVTVEPEIYQAVCLTDGAPPAAELLAHERETLAAIIADEARTGGLAPTMVEDALKHVIRYYEEDAVIIGWENAIIAGVRDSYEDVLDVMELANLELLEFRTYDAYLDRRLDEAFHTLDRLWAPGGLFRSARGPLADISQLRVDFARLTDNLHDTGKMFGEWYLAKVHQRLRDRFHLPDWERAVASKMATLEDMFQLAEEEANHRRAMVLEGLIVLLFVLDLILIYLVST